MRLLDVRAVLHREENIQQAGSKTKVLEELDDKTTEYAILSHRWGKEVDYDEMTGLMKMDEQDRNEVRQRDGYRKIIKSCEQSMTDGYTWLWIDTCCIDKRSSVALSEAIGTMHQWYRSSQLCYVYLNDVDELAFPTEPDFNRFGRSNSWPEWFSRGWTLQELIAPTEVEFFNKDWVSISTKRDLTYTISRITGISSSILWWGLPRSGPEPNVAQILSWAADRKTTRVEDRAYSLLGLFDVNMPMLYGEGSKAFRRLQFEIIRASSNHTIFAWNPKGCLVSGGGVLADDPSCFRGCHDMKELGREEFVDELGAYLLQNLIDVDADPRNIRSLLYSVDPPPSRFNITDLGIQVSLPVLSDGDDHCFKAILPCLDSYGNLVTIDLCYNRLCFSRRRPSTSIMNTISFCKSPCLDCFRDGEKICHTLRLNDKCALWHGFARCGAFPYNVAGDAFTLSLGNTLVVLVYANDNTKSRFAVGCGCCFGREWTRVVCDECPVDQEAWSSYLDFAKQAAHLPRSIWDARIVRGNNYGGYTDVMINIEQCPGCCTGSRQYTDIFLPLLELELDGESTQLYEWADEEIALGDYGNYGDSRLSLFKHHGNIFEDIQELGINPRDLVYHPVISHVSSRTLRAHQTVNSPV